MIKIYKYGEVSYDEIFARDNIASNVEGIVTDIIKNVRSRGDEALFEYSAKFDKAELSSLEVSSEEIEEAFASVDAEFVSIIEEAAENIRAFSSRGRDGVTRADISVLTTVRLTPTLRWSAL